MFEALRKMIFPIIIIVLLFFVGMIVLQWGLDLSSRGVSTAKNVAGIINGEEIPWTVYSRTYNNLYKAEAEKLQDEQEVSSEKIQELQTSAWNQILADRLMTQQIEKHEIVVTEQEVYDYLKGYPPQNLQAMPYFQTEGKFDYQKYLSAMANPEMAGFWTEMEQIVRVDIRKMKLQEIVVQTAHVTEPEVRSYFMETTERVKVGMVNVSYARFSAPPPPISEEEIEEYYQNHLDDFKIGEQASLGLCLLEKAPNREDWARTYERSKSLYDSLLAGADFKAMANDLSEDIGSAQDSGDLGWFPPGRMVSEFDRAAFSMKDGEISEPVRTQFGWHILKHHGFREAETPSTSETPVQEAHVSHILIKTYPSTDALDAIHERLQTFRDAAEEQGFFVVAEEQELPATTTGLFQRDSNIPSLGANKAAEIFAFETKLGTISEVLENESAYYVLEAAAREAEGHAELVKVRDEVRMALQKEKVQALCRDTANAIWAEIQGGVDIKEAAENHGDEYETPTEFARGAYVRGLGRAPEAIGAAFGLKNPGDKTPPVEFDQGCVILELLEKNTPDLAEFTAKRDSLRTQIMTAKRQELFGRWYQNLMESSDIVNNTQRVGEESDYM